LVVASDRSHVASTFGDCAGRGIRGPGALCSCVQAGYTNDTTSVATNTAHTVCEPHRAPLKVRVVTFGSDIAMATIVNADNKAAGVGAVWDFTGAIDGKSC
jgi:hypothetical protein